MNIYKNQKGETIVEVLLAITIIASVMGGAYAIAARSNTTIQANKERYQAQLYANSQADTLKAFASDHKPDVDDFVTTGQNFCINNNHIYIDTDTAHCNKTEGGATYKISTKGNISTGTYVITIKWDSLVNTTGDSVRLVYGL
jgi:type II secretory pathway pseudopilin PulG